MSGWNTLESDPGVFTHLLRAFAPVACLDVSELYALDEASFPNPCHALLFLFRWDRNRAAPQAAPTPPVGGDGDDTAPATTPPVFFRQTIGNACGTIALLHALLAVPGVEGKLTPELADFVAFARNLDAVSAGDALEANAVIKSTHNSFARPEPFAHEGEDGDTDAYDPDVFHFISYLPHGGGVWELDGLQAGPTLLGPLPAGGGGGWARVASDALQRRIAVYSASEIRFNLLALTDDPRGGLTRQVACLRGQLAKAHALLLSQGVDAAGGGLPHPDALAAELGVGGVEAVEDGSGDDALAGGDVAAQFQRAASRLASVAGALQDEEGKHARYEVENARRRHNFIPFIMEVLAQAAKSGELGSMYEAGRKRAGDAARRSAEEGGAGGGV